jgi:FkbM family methyltransferase
MSGTEYSYFELKGVSIRIPQEILSKRMHEAFDSGKYEALEARYMHRILKPGDRLLELGGGVGFISALAGKTVELEACIVVEANPVLCEVITETHRRNGLNFRVLNAVACTAGDARTSSIPFYLRENFWGSSLDGTRSYRSVMNVARLDLQKLIEEFQPTIIICDIEGAEVDLVSGIDFSSVDRLYFEVHKAETGLKGIHSLFRNLLLQGFSYDPDNSVGAVILFSKIDQVSPPMSE